MLDHPTRVTRLSYDSVFAAPVWITPETNWQGSYDSGWVYNSADGNDCKRISSGAYDNQETTDPGYTYSNGGEGIGSGSVGGTPPDSITVCVQVDWPAPYQWKSKLEHGRGRIGPYAWMGSLIEGGRDLTGQLYMRNRFYDPASGRFTQEDPIGIAGGLNLYGFAGGDPVSYSDPYGLCPGIIGTDFFTVSDCPRHYFENVGKVFGAAVGFDIGAGVGGTGGGALGLACGPGAPACSTGGAIVGAHVAGVAGAAGGALLGALAGQALDNALQSNRDESGGGSQSPQYKVRKPGVTGREAASDAPSWVRGERPLVGENGNQFARRLLDEKYGAGNWKTGPGSEFNQIPKFADRAFIDP